MTSSSNPTLEGMIPQYNFTPNFSDQLRGLAHNDSFHPTLNLSGNQIGPTGAVTISQLLLFNSTFTKLNLSCNQIGDIGAAAIAQSLTSNPSLTILNLTGNKLGPT